MSDLDRYLTDEVVDKASKAAWPLTGYQDSRMEKARAALAAVLPDLLRQAKAEAWEEGARAAWDRSTPAINGALYYWRRVGDPENPYRSHPSGAIPPPETTTTLKGGSHDAL